MKRLSVIALIWMTSPSILTAQDVGSRVFSCVPMEVYQMTIDGLREAPADVVRARTDGRDFLFEEATGIKTEPQTGRSVQYMVLNPQNLLGTPVVAVYGELNPSFLRFAMIDENDPTRFAFFLFGGSVNVFGQCVVS